MLCRNCPKRRECRAPCSALEKELEQLETCPDEQVEEEKILELIYEKTGAITGLEEEVELEELELSRVVNRLPVRIRKVIIGYFYEGKGFSVLAKELKISRTLVYKRYEQGLSRLRRYVSSRLESKKNRLYKILLSCLEDEQE